MSIAEIFDISMAELQQLSNFEKLLQAGTIRDVINGVLNPRIKIYNHPFNLQKNEQFIWIFENVKYYEVKTRTRYEGGSQGVSVRVMKGMYYRTGSFKGNPVQYSETTHIATGILGVTQKHIYFHSSKKSFRIPYSKIISFQNFSDGIGIQRDAQTAKPQMFITGDGWFINNLIQNAAQCFNQ